jgi:putative two-component system response regulator
MRALVVDDDPVAVALLKNILKGSGFDVDIAVNGLQAIDKLRQTGARLLVTDWEMPEMNGIELCNAVRREDFAGYVYIIMITAKDQAQQKIDGINAGADNFITKPVNPAELQVCLKSALRILSLETRDLALFALAKLAESRDPDTGYHLERVQSYARLLAQELSVLPKYKNVIDREFVGLIYQTSPLHDIGKVGIPDRVLLKAGKLTEDERTIMKTHAKLGAQTLEASLQRFPGAKFLTMARDIAATHHEKYDGSGYPCGLAGNAIPLCGRIVALADVYDALTSRRIYKHAMTHEEAKAIIVGESGKHFDPDVVGVFLHAEAHFIAIKGRLVDVEVEAAPHVAEESASVTAESQGPFPEPILIVEDDPMQREHLCSVLRVAGHTVLSAADAVEAESAWMKFQPRVIVCDWLLPGISGVHLCTRIRAMSKNRYVQFIMVSVLTGQAQILEAFEAGVDDFLRKPFDAGELVARIRAGLRSVRLHDDLAVKNQGSRELNDQLSQLNKRLETLAITDDLTGLYNVRHAKTRLEEQWALADRYNRPLTVALVDVDRFKTVNDTHGHAAGNLVLKQVTQTIREATRSTDTLCRVGGDEFLIIFAAQSVEEALLVAERIRSTIAEREFGEAGMKIRLTVSIGVCTRGKSMSESAALMAEMDRALYAAKQAGRNIVRQAGLPTSEKDAA